MPTRDDLEYVKDQKFIMESLSEIKKDMKEAKTELSSIKTEVALLKVKSGLWGGAAGVLTYASTYVLEYLKRR